MKFISLTLKYKNYQLLKHLIKLTEKLITQDNVKLVSSILADLYEQLSGSFYMKEDLDNRLKIEYDEIDYYFYYWSQKTKDLEIQARCSYRMGLRYFKYENYKKSKKCAM